MALFTLEPDGTYRPATEAEVFAGFVRNYYRLVTAVPGVERVLCGQCQANNAEFADLCALCFGEASSKETKEAAFRPIYLRAHVFGHHGAYCEDEDCYARSGVERHLSLGCPATMAEADNGVDELYTLAVHESVVELHVEPLVRAHDFGGADEHGFCVVDRACYARSHVPWHAGLPCPLDVNDAMKPDPNGAHRFAEGFSTCQSTGCLANRTTDPMPKCPASWTDVTGDDGDCPF